MHVIYTRMMERYVYLLISFNWLRFRIVCDNGTAISLKSRGYCF